MAKASGLPLTKLHGLADRAILGALSRTYRTCGKPACHCMRQEDEKHGPHLYLSFRGVEGRTTGFYVPQRFEAAVREGLLAWTELQRTLRRGVSVGERRRVQRPLWALAESNAWRLRALWARPRRRRRVS